MKLKRRLMKLAVVSAATYLFDPTLGAQRRRQLRAKIDELVAKRRNRGAHDATGPALTIADANGHITPRPDPEAELVVAGAPRS